MTDDLELRLVDASGPNGEIRARDLAVLADALQELRLRIGRELINTAGPGRTKQYMEELTEIRLSGIAAGSTVLTFAQGPTDKLDGILSEEKLLDKRFHEIVEAIGRDQRPEWATDLIADSAARLVEGLKSVAPEVIVHSGSGVDVSIQTDHIHRETWTTSRRTVHPDEVAISGLLEKVDIRSHDLRVRDDVGNALALSEVSHDVEAGALIGRRVTATGRAVRSRDGILTGVSEPVIVASELPAGISIGPQPSVSLSDLVGSVPGPDPAGAAELTDEEFAEFMEAIGR